jgi:hypothetical protein
MESPEQQADIANIPTLAAELKTLLSSPVALKDSPAPASLTASMQRLLAKLEAGRSTMDNIIGATETTTYSPQQIAKGLKDMKEICTLLPIATKDELASFVFQSESPQADSLQDLSSLKDHLLILKGTKEKVSTNLGVPSKMMEDLRSYINGKDFSDILKSFYQNANVSQVRKDEVELQWRAGLRIELNTLRNRVDSMPFSGEDTSLIKGEIEAYESRLSEFMMQVEADANAKKIN